MEQFKLEVKIQMKVLMIFLFQMKMIIIRRIIPPQQTKKISLIATIKINNNTKTFIYKINLKPPLRYKNHQYLNLNFGHHPLLKVLMKIVKAPNLCQI